MSSVTQRADVMAQDDVSNSSYVDVNITFANTSEVGLDTDLELPNRLWSGSRLGGYCCGNFLNGICTFVSSECVNCTCSCIQHKRCRNNKVAQMTRSVSGISTLGAAYGTDHVTFQPLSKNYSQTSHLAVAPTSPLRPAFGTSAMGPLGHQPHQLQVFPSAPPSPLPPFPPYPPPPYSTIPPPPPPPASSAANHVPPTENHPPTTNPLPPSVPVILEPPAEEEPGEPPLIQNAPRPAASAPVGRRNLWEDADGEGNLPRPAVYIPPRSARF